MLTARNAQSVPSAHHRPRSARRTCHSNYNSSGVHHCLPGHASPLQREVKKGKRTSSQIAMRGENHAQRLRLTRSTPQSCLSCLETKVGSLLISPVGRCQPFQREWGQTLPYMVNKVKQSATRRDAAGEVSREKRDRGSKIRRIKEKKKKESKLTLNAKQQQKSRD